MRSKHDVEKNTLQNKINSLEKELEVKNDLISHLKSQKPTIDTDITQLLEEATRKLEIMTSSMILNNSGITNSDRPQMENVFIDPIEKSMEVEKHFEIEDVSTDEKALMDDKVNKLKGLLGKLPSKKD